MRLFVIATMLLAASLAACQTEIPEYQGNCPPRAREAGFCDWPASRSYPVFRR
jgi:hypothetical protein